MSSIETNETAESLGLSIFSEGVTSVDVSKLSDLGSKIYIGYMSNLEKLDCDRERRSMELENTSQCSIDHVGVIPLTDEEQTIVWKVYYEHYIRPLEVSTGLRIRLELGDKTVVRCVKNDEGLIKEIALALAKPK